MNTDEMIEKATLVLKSHVALASSLFPENTSGSELDLLARQPLLKHNLDYLHGTGHGVGYFSNVHEGPHRISIHAKKSSALQKNMIAAFFNVEARTIERYVGDNADVFVIEETLAGCGIGSVLSAELARIRPNCRIFEKNLGDRYVTHGSMIALYDHYGLDSLSIAEYVQEVHKVEN